MKVAFICKRTDCSLTWLSTFMVEHPNGGRLSQWIYWTEQLIQYSNTVHDFVGYGKDYRTISLAFDVNSEFCTSTVVSLLCCHTFLNCRKNCKRFFLPNGLLGKEWGPREPYWPNHRLWSFHKLSYQLIFCHFELQYTFYHVIYFSLTPYAVNWDLRKYKSSMKYPCSC